MAPPHGKVEVVFTDREGVRWQVYEFGILGGRALRYPVGTVRGVYRGFVTLEPPRRRRAVLLAKPADCEAARVLSVHELQAELDRSTDWDERGKRGRGG